jgi:hypothetical protein
MYYEKFYINRCFLDICSSDVIVEYDVAATAMTASVDGIYQNDYVTSSAQGRAVLAVANRI